MTDSNITQIRDSVHRLCTTFGEDYWKDLDADRAYPTEFVKKLTDEGFLGCLIPEAYGGAGLGLIEACAILEEISRAGGHPGAAHAQMYVMGSLLRHGTDAQKTQYLPAIAAKVNCGCRVLQSPNRRQALIPPRLKQPLSVMAMTISSTARKYGFRGSNTPT